ncbi:MAG: hypothetical protein JW771_06820 [Candidatus Thermoplasmatota archaeon]|nr:hypothetical protein [Candidatus Thermoplasmatota archaeon]
MTHRYGIYQSSPASCVFYKQDEDGNQSTFNIFAMPVSPAEKKKALFAFIDNEGFKKESWSGTKETDIKKVIDSFGAWAADAPIVFELEAKKSMGECLRSVMQEE